MSKWISVDERLPEHQCQYLVAYYIKVYDRIMNTELLVGLDSFRGKSVWAKNLYHKVLFWQPMPEPPQMEHDETISI